ncbi:helix-turn-helix domain-containing protein [Rhizobium sp. RU20A]|uniref:helix-turn-helix domain-containing protein n=1 Tax=Rhizobium sp. RU20A TaxID=1907412 RepID=UPI001FCF0273|nr:helix-turn-helix domain-containing protein [Rhizobium sp. RU20A]
MSAETMFRRLASQGQDDTLGGRIWRARDALQLTQEDLACHLGLPDATVASWEGDRDEPQSKSLFQLAGVLGVSPAWLIAGIGAGPDEGDCEVPERMQGGTAGGPSLSTLQRELERLRRQHATTAAAIERLEATLAQIGAGKTRPW